MVFPSGDFTARCLLVSQSSLMRSKKISTSGENIRNLSAEGRMLYDNLVYNSASISTYCIVPSEPNQTISPINQN